MPKKALKLKLKEEKFSASLRKLFYCDVYISICAQHAESIEGKVLYERRSSSASNERERKCSSFPLHIQLCLLMEYSWEPCSMLFDGMRRSPQSCVQIGWVVFQFCQLCRSVEGEHILFSPSEYRFSSVFSFFLSAFREYPSWFPCCCIHFTNSSEGKKRKLSAKRGREEKFVLPTLNAFSKLLFCVFHFPFLPFSRLRTFHWLGTT